MDTTGASGVFAREFDEIGRAVEVGFAGGRVISVSFPETAPADASADHDLLDRIEAFLGGERDAFEDVATGLTVPTDRRAVLEALGTIPYGEEVSVSRLTRLAALDADDPGDLELVTGALRENPIPILFPDHRVQGGPYATPGEVRAELRRAEGL
ncbi:MGMT family protein [Halorubrum lipolyticum]|uniref:Methylated-DNA--protein-cysteine methyltransferase n=1 Tax=Halorubrum lipolyticum DSM 21995 TaxID=1227482 RepID=M0P4C0_9EURY|nr:MGMT family protein [Halorubrum lipolyticum]EMA63670.1 methylated-DNA--protein-cysteine methyltransferase [Halorubrum lipolyticum DSM 21995]